MYFFCHTSSSANPVFSCPLPVLKSRWQCESLCLCLTSLSRCLHTTWSTALTGPSCSPFQGTHLPSMASARNHGVTLDNQLYFAADSCATTRSCTLIFPATSERYVHSSPRRQCRFWFQALHRHLAPRILQLAAGWCACMCHHDLELIQNAAAQLMFNQVLPHYNSLHYPVMATGGNSNPIQDTDVCLLAYPTSRTWSNPTPSPPATLCCSLFPPAIIYFNLFLFCIEHLEQIQPIWLLLMYSHDSCSFWVLSSCLNVFIVSRFGHSINWMNVIQCKWLYKWQYTTLIQ